MLSLFVRVEKQVRLTGNREETPNSKIKPERESLNSEEPLCGGQTDERGVFVFYLLFNVLQTVSLYFDHILNSFKPRVCRVVEL